MSLLPLPVRLPSCACVLTSTQGTKFQELCVPALSIQNCLRMPSIHQARSTIWQPSGTSSKKACVSSACTDLCAHKLCQCSPVCAISACAHLCALDSAQGLLQVCGKHPKLQAPASTQQVHNIASAQKVQSIASAQQVHSIRFKLSVKHQTCLIRGNSAAVGGKKNGAPPTKSLQVTKGHNSKARCTDRPHGCAFLLTSCPGHTPLPCPNHTLLLSCPNHTLLLPCPNHTLLLPCPGHTLLPCPGQSHLP